VHVCLLLLADEVVFSTQSGRTEYRGAVLEDARAAGHACPGGVILVRDTTLKQVPEAGAHSVIRAAAQMGWDRHHIRTALVPYSISWPPALQLPMETIHHKLVIAHAGDYILAKWVGPLWDESRPWLWAATWKRCDSSCVHKPLSLALASCFTFLVLQAYSRQRGDCTCAAVCGRTATADVQVRV
jgi:hypothetical protein